jgi:putative hemolysin
MHYDFCYLERREITQPQLDKFAPRGVLALNISDDPEHLLFIKFVHSLKGLCEWNGSILLRSMSEAQPAPTSIHLQQHGDRKCPHNLCPTLSSSSQTGTQGLLACECQQVLDRLWSTDPSISIFSSNNTYCLQWGGEEEQHEQGRYPISQ